MGDIYVRQLLGGGRLEGACEWIRRGHMYSCSVSIAVKNR